MHYLNAQAENKPNGIKNFIDVANVYDQRFPSFATAQVYNDWAWVLFEKSNDKQQLEKALEWAEKGLKKITPVEGRYGGILDTYANILHKLGRTTEALEWQAKAVAASPNDSGIKEAYEKMKAGKQTWPELK